MLELFLLLDFSCLVVFSLSSEIRILLLVPPACRRVVLVHAVSVSIDANFSVLLLVARFDCEGKKKPSVVVQNFEARRDEWYFRKESR